MDMERAPLVAAIIAVVIMVFGILLLVSSLEPSTGVSYTTYYFTKTYPQHGWIEKCSSYITTKTFPEVNITKTITVTTCTNIPTFTFEVMTFMSEEGHAYKYYGPVNYAGIILGAAFIAIAFAAMMILAVKRGEE